MSKKSDDSIERIFRQALTQYETTFQERDWLKMEKLLNEEANRRAAARSRRVKGTAYTLTGLTGLIIAVYFLAFRNPSGSIAELNNAVDEVQVTGDPDKNGIVKLEGPSAGLPSETSSATSTELPSERGTGGVTDKTSASDSNPSALKDANSPYKSFGEQQTPSSKENGTGSKDQLQKDHALLNSGGDNNKKPDQLANPNQATTKKSSIHAIPSDVSPAVDGPVTWDTVPTGQSTTDEKGSRNQSLGEISGAATQLNVVTTPTEPGGARSTPPGPDSENIEMTSMTAGGAENAKATTQDSVLLQEKINLSNSPDSLDDAKTKPDEPAKVKPPYRWSVGIILAPEFSTTSLGEYSAPGASLGVRIGYQVSNRLNIKTGIIRSTKKYEGDGYDYTPRNPLYWQIRTNGVVPEEIDSKCLVYELPVGVQFDAIQTPKSRVFLSATISSYFMISQAYDYTFDSPNPGADMGWRSSGSESYWFSVGMMSAGYERYVHRSFAIGIEPYLKVSLAEIGWPNIKLFSAGAYVTLRYRFMKRNNME